MSSKEIPVYSNLVDYTNKHNSNDCYKLFEARSSVSSNYFKILLLIVIWYWNKGRNDCDGKLSLVRVGVTN